MPKQQPSHIEVFFKSARRVRREHIAGETMGEGHEIMAIVPKGAKRRLSAPVARDLIVSELVLEVNAQNREAIAAIEKEALAEKAANDKRIADKNRKAKAVAA